jgi:hypothetical protein
MLVVIDGAVYNSEEDKVSILIFQNERKPLMQCLAGGDDVFNSFPAGTPAAAVDENVKVLNQAKMELTKPEAPDPAQLSPEMLDKLKKQAEDNKK